LLVSWEAVASMIEGKEKDSWKESSFSCIAYNIIV
jgi:hypothetical protein